RRLGFFPSASKLTIIFNLGILLSGQQSASPSFQLGVSIRASVIHHHSARRFRVLSAGRGDSFLPAQVSTAATGAGRLLGDRRRARSQRRARLPALPNANGWSGCQRTLLGLGDLPFPSMFSGHLIFAL